jgi:uncharacterized membrane protein YgcG
MKTRRVNGRYRVLLLILMLCCIVPRAQAAERELRWDALDVEARLNADGVLDVIERHTMVFTGDWNGGERVFNVRPRQKLEFVDLVRMDAKTGSPQPLQEASVPDNVDEFTWTDRRTLRWRSRLPSDPPFENTRLTYVLYYRLSGILRKDDTQYRIDHDFAFPDRSGPIARFTLNLDLDPAWQPLADFRNQYSADSLEPGQSFVLDIPLRYAGSEVPVSIDTARPIEIRLAVITILGGFALFVLAFVARERSLGRFAPVDPPGIDGAWIENNILAHPAEVVGAAWDGRVGASEVVALIARMTAEGKLESQAEGGDSMTLRLMVGRDALTGHERALVDGLFFDNRTETSTKQVQQHYQGRGFDPAIVVRPRIDERVKKALPPGDSRVGRWPGLALGLIGVALLLWFAFSQPEIGAVAVGVAIASLFLGMLLQIPGYLFRSRMDWGLGAAALLLLPALLVVLGVSAFLWFAAGTGAIELPWTMTAALTALALAISNGSINGLKSRQSREAIAFRKRLTTGRSYFLRELEKPQPDLQDSWYPWLLAFGLGRQVDVWSSHHSTTTTSASSWSHHTSHSSSSSSSPSSPSSSPSSSTNTGWSGGGGLSGGAGASGTWAAAAAGMAAGVAAPSSSSSGGGSSSSSSGGSSGGGGGGGW